MPLQLVFVNQRASAEVVLRHVRAAGWSGVTLSSDKSQKDREAALQAIKDGHVQALVATDVAGRGIDISDVCEYPLSPCYHTQKSLTT
jgi:ATP-dependent RNA helicase DDX23/PRP28